MFQNEIDVLFIAPETISGSFRILVSKPGFPRISFICVDEVHCLSEWSHNFRSSYISMKSALNALFTPKCYLGMTGTASAATISTTADILGIPADGQLLYSFNRSNLFPTISWVANNDEKFD